MNPPTPQPDPATGTAAAPSPAPALLAAIVFVAFLDNFAQYPILTPFAISLGASTFLAGWILGAYSLSNMAGNLVAGPLLDRYGPARPLAASLALTAIVLVGYAFATSAGGLLALRLLHGAAAAAIVPAVFVMAATHRSGQGPLARNSALGAAVGTAAVAAPPASGILAARAGFAAVYLTLAALFVTVAFVSRFATTPRAPAPRPAGAPHRAAAKGESDAVGRGLAPVFRSARSTPLPHTWAGAAAVVFGVGGLALLLPLHTAALGVPEPTRTTGQLMAAFSLTAVAVMAVMARRRHTVSLAAILGLAAGGLCLMGAALAALGLGHGLAGMTAAVAVLGAGFGLAFPGLTAAVAATAPASIRGRAFAVFYAFFSAGAFLGPALVGAAVGRWHLGAGYLTAAVVPFAAGLLGLARARRQRLSA